MIEDKLKEFDNKVVAVGLSVTGKEKALLGDIGSKGILLALIKQALEDIYQKGRQAGARGFYKKLKKSKSPIGTELFGVGSKYRDALDESYKKEITHE